MHVQPGVEKGEGGNEVGATHTTTDGNEEVLIQFNTSLPNIAVGWAVVSFAMLLFHQHPAHTLRMQNLTNGPIDAGNDTQISNYTTFYQYVTPFITVLFVYPDDLVSGCTPTALSPAT